MGLFFFGSSTVIFPTVIGRVGYRATQATRPRIFGEPISQHASCMHALPLEGTLPLTGIRHYGLSFICVRYEYNQPRSNHVSSRLVLFISVTACVKRSVEYVARFTPVPCPSPSAERTGSFRVMLDEQKHVCFIFSRMEWWLSRIVTSKKWEKSRKKT